MSTSQFRPVDREVAEQLLDDAAAGSARPGDPLAQLLTAAGVSAGIDMALWLVGELHGADFARVVQRGMEYDPAPPYAAFT